MTRYIDDNPLHQTDIACAWLVCHSQEGLCKLYPFYPASPEAQASSLFGEASHATPHQVYLNLLGCRTPPQLHAGGVGQQKQHGIPLCKSIHLVLFLYRTLKTMCHLKLLRKMKRIRKRRYSIFIVINFIFMNACDVILYISLFSVSSMFNTMMPIPVPNVI